MAKNILIFSDGTQNTKRTRTNVYQLYRAARDFPANKCFYDPGVGSFTADIAGAAFGRGMSENIRQCYNFLVNHYRPGDKIFLFGFSRGAYTVRSLANFVSLVGLVKKTRKRKLVSRSKRGARYKSLQSLLVERAYRLYKKNRAPDFQQERDSCVQEWGLRECPIYVLGLWDTVGALGLPNFFSREAFKAKHAYHRMDLHKDLRYVYHAMAIDEERRIFYPIPAVPNPQASKQTVEEVWFSGMHSNIGGGYVRREGPGPKDLSNISLHWMIKKIGAKLKLDKSRIGPGRPTGHMHNSVSGKYKHAGTRRRVLPAGAKIHKSVLTRIEKSLAQELDGPFTIREPHGAYRPVALEHKQKNFKIDYKKPPGYGIDKRYTIVS